MNNIQTDDEKDDREETPVDPPAGVTAPSGERLRGATDDDPRERADVLDDDVTRQ